MFTFLTFHLPNLFNLSAHVLIATLPLNVSAATSGLRLDRKLPSLWTGRTSQFCLWIWNQRFFIFIYFLFTKKTLSFPFLTKCHPLPVWLFATQRPMGIQQVRLTERRIIPVMAQFVTVQSSRPLNTFKHVTSSRREEARNLFMLSVITHRMIKSMANF